MKDFQSGTEGLICQQNCEGWMVGVWEGRNLGSIPNDHMPSQKDPKISIDRRCSTILPNPTFSYSQSNAQLLLPLELLYPCFPEHWIYCINIVNLRKIFTSVCTNKIFGCHENRLASDCPRIVHWDRATTYPITCMCIIQK